jgi:hypothetical protein
MNEQLTQPEELTSSIKEMTFILGLKKNKYSPDGEMNMGNVRKRVQYDCTKHKTLLTF